MGKPAHHRFPPSNIQSVSACRNSTWRAQAWPALANPHTTKPPPTPPPRLRICVPVPTPSCRNSTRCAQAWYYCTIQLREHILVANGSRIRPWWIWHHYLSIVVVAILVIWPEGWASRQFYPHFNWFCLYASMCVCASGPLYCCWCYGDARRSFCPSRCFRSIGGKTSGARWEGECRRTVLPRAALTWCSELRAYAGVVGEATDSLMRSIFPRAPIIQHGCNSWSSSTSGGGCTLCVRWAKQTPCSSRRKGWSPGRAALRT